ncbi:hypothetical protein ABIB25_003683 [Nakamurella sp. UYEF19]
MSGTGKSTALEALGHRTVDTDDPGWIVEVGTDHGGEPMWDLDRMSVLLSGHRQGWLFVSGCVTNQASVYDRFDAVVLLSAPVDVILSRVMDRANPFGSEPQHRAQIASDVAEFEPRPRAGAGHEIVTTLPVDQVVVALERIATYRARNRPPNLLSER